MEAHSMLLYFFSSSPVLQDKRFDIVGNLPIEISVMILRNLDPRSLLSAAMVNKRLLSFCRADSTLCQRIKQQIVIERRESLNPFRVTVDRQDRNNLQPFTSVNVHRRVTFTPVSNSPILHASSKAKHTAISSQQII
ncbi:uncharacterized protein [Periplaneta americana]|uniref:uncharacterized protein n=1 Tax=Periplaneta americana TaxID=6978 RepID=UPI0037E7FCC7